MCHILKIHLVINFIIIISLLNKVIFLILIIFIECKQYTWYIIFSVKIIVSNNVTKQKYG